jgi:hypothetical protein
VKARTARSKRLYRAWRNHNKKYPLQFPPLCIIKWSIRRDGLGCEELTYVEHVVYVNRFAAGAGRKSTKEEFDRVKSYFLNKEKNELSN